MPKQTSNPHRGAWLVYVNGILIPTQSVSVSYGVGQIPEANFMIPPSKLMARLGNEDRVDVTMFYLDTLADPDNPEFRLLFEGEISGWSYTSSAAGRMMSFDCLAHISIFKALVFSFMNNVDATVQNYTVADPTRISQPGVFYPYTLFQKGLLSQTTTPQDVKIPFEILFNVVSSMIDQSIDTKFRAIPAVNFFARWIRKNNFQNRFVALPLIEDSNAVATGVFPMFQAQQDTLGLDTMRHDLAATIGNAGSLWDVLHEVFGVVYEEIFMFPTAPVVRATPDTGFILGTVDTIPASAAPSRLVNYGVKPQMFFGIPPACNLIFPSLLRSFTYSENYRTQPTRLYVNESFIPSQLPQNPITLAALRVGYPPAINSQMQQDQLQAMAQPGASVTRASYENPKNVLVWPEEFFKGPVTSSITLPKWFYLLASRTAAAKAVNTAENNDPVADVPSLLTLFKGYSEYEYYRQRYAQRGGNINMVFNPYILPGFSCMLFDRRQQPLDVTGYVMSVTHTMTSGHMETNASYSFGRTLTEMLTLLGTIVDANTDATKDFISAPLEPIEQISNIIQDHKTAETFYKNFLFGKATPPNNKTASADFRNLVAFPPPPKGNGQPFVIDTKQITSRLKNNQSLDVVIYPGKEAVFDDHDTAMQYISRPICSLEEYVQFIHGDVGLPALTNAALPVVQYPLSDFGDAIYWQRIKRFRPGPGAAPPSSQTNSTSDGENTYTDTIEAVPADYPQTRYDWDTLLLEYSTQMLASAPQYG